MGVSSLEGTVLGVKGEPKVTICFFWRGSLNKNTPELRFDHMMPCNPIPCNPIRRGRRLMNSQADGHPVANPLIVQGKYKRI